MRNIWVLAVVGASLVAGACGGNGNPADGAGSAEQTAAEVRTLLEITADDFSFDVADSVPAGHVDVRLENVGKQPHHAVVYRLSDGLSYDEFKTAVLKDQSQFPALAEKVGGVDAGVLSGSSSIERSGDPWERGIYAVACFIRDVKTAKNHYQLGMMTDFTVR